ncbi:NADH-quinone oxidoreductase subunit A [Geomonas subterranea]|uniref:NADH-quinone oxidoreductase subunit A n=1 Tax=Geomonas subterranea TaxID=2847989 RepID=A0ABX8LGP7_9BACT|nr:MULTISPECIES: NADH-quinone oxidoreductase subunit A [Geomonas]QXE89877.1 NADH-quinone oxidoreductase subunit A [Geomonas subterranea]QXM08005.1 NADH-quinone oxidoreductase subunit A [Geomonas subterranea]
MPVTAQQVEFIPLAIYTVIAVGLIGVLLAAAYFLGSGHDSADKHIPYESGVAPTGAARHTSQVPFYLIAIFFIVFDVEGSFILTWATAWDLLGIQGLVHITVFIVILMLGLVWLWMKGGLEWGPSATRTRGRS